MSVDAAAIPSHLMWQDQQMPTAKNALGKDDFMKLLMTQLQNQDPLNPMEHEQFAAQLAQFGSLEKLTHIEGGIKGIQNGFNQEAKLQALGMIGKEVTATGSTVDLQQGGNVSVPLSLGEGDRPLKVTLYDGQGALIRSIDLSQHVGGHSEFTWDGKSDSGELLPSGKYSFRVLAVGKDGQAKETSSDIKGQVAAVDVTGKVPTLVVKTPEGNKRVEVGKVVSVNMAAAEAPRVPKVSVPGVKAEAPPSTPQDFWSRPSERGFQVGDSGVVSLFGRQR